jgi:ATP-dependent Lhr-like helicase
VDAWRRFLLEARCGALEPGVLDQPFLSGRWAWFRPPATGRGQRVVNASPVALVRRAKLDAWRALRGAQAPAAVDGRRDRAAQAVFEALERRGAAFMEDLERETGLAQDQVEPGLRQLVYEGAVTADAFSPLCWLLRPERVKARTRARLAAGRGGAEMPLGRWSALPPPVIADDERNGVLQEQQALATVCLALLRRYGVVFRAVLERETLLPPWRTLLAYLRRMEDRGEVRGGRFVDGFSGEQFALPEAVGLLRQSATPSADAAMVVVSAADPLNLGGIVLPGPRTASVAGHRVLLEDGQPAARLVADEFEELPGISARGRRVAREALCVVTPWRRVR